MIAITAVACRFPGAPDADSFWRQLVEGREGLTRFSKEELARRGVARGLREQAGYVPVGGLIEGQDRFDPVPFGLTGAEAALMDPQQRLFLETAWQGLEQAGHGGGTGAGAVGVFAGAGHSAYLTSNLAGRWSPTGGGADPIGSLQTAMSTHTDYLPLQVAYRLNLTGPAIAVNTTCSTSLVAVHLAAQSLLDEECDTAIAGGVSLIVPQGHGYLHVADGIYSADGTVRPFSADATGIVYSQGVGVVVLRRLADALADGDPVLAVVHGTAVNNDGADKAGFTAPSLRGQARVIAEAQAVAGVTPGQIGYVEAHGTATRLGDPVEIAALRRVFGESGPAWCGLGSVKSNIGHANTAAGVASLIKTTLAIRHRTLPASLHAEPLNDLLGLAGSPFEVVTSTRHWEGPDYAGVSSFGIGGTNAHLVLGPPPERPESTEDERPQLLVASAHDRASAEATAAAIAEHTTVSADLAHTLQSGRRELPYRVAVATRPGTAPAALRDAPPVKSSATTPRVVFAFPGAGSQYLGMGATLYEEESVFRSTVDECAELLAPLLGADVRDAITATASTGLVRDAGFGLPALFAASVATARLLMSWGVRPDAVVGHSLGEYSAAVVAGALTLPDAARLVAVRCARAAKAAGGGGMLALRMSEDDVMDVLTRHPDLDLAAVNAPGACVVSGPREGLAVLAAEYGERVSELRVDAALHSRLVEPAVPAVRAAAGGLRPRPLTTELVTTVTGRLAGAELFTADHWARQLREPVRFADALRTCLGDSGDPAIVVQAGPGGALAALARHNRLDALIDAIPVFTADETDAAVSIRDAVGRLWTHGVTVDFAAQHNGSRRRIAAPGYAFQRRELWIEPTTSSTPDDTSGAGAGAAEPLQIPRWHQLPPLPRPPSLTGRWLVVASGDDPLAESVRAELTALGAECLPAVTPETPGLTGVVVVPATSAIGAVGQYAELARTLTVATPLLLQVTRAAERIDGRDQAMPDASAARVLPRVLAQELRGIRWRTLDLPADDDSGSAIAVARELADLAGDPASGLDVALRGGTRFARTFVPWHPRDDESAAPGGTALVTGGLGDVGLTLARYLASTGRRVVLTSRSGLPDDGPRRAAIDRLAEEGAEIDVRTLDAADGDGTAALLDELCTDGSDGLDVVVHAAGVVATDGALPLRETGAEHIGRHLRAKAEGALALRSAIDRLPAERRPRVVVLMSSATTLVGGIGMGAYAAANAVLDGIAMSAMSGISEGSTRWVSAVWDGWSAGPLGEERAVVLDHALDAATGTAAFARLLDTETPPVVAVSATGLEHRMAAAATVRAQAGSTEITASTVSISDDPVRDAIASLWGELFGSPVTSADDDFFALGGHSLLATRMLAEIGERFGVQLRLRDVLANPTVAALGELVRASVQQPGPGPEHNGHTGIADDGTFPLTRVQHAYWVGRDGGYEWGDVPCHFYLEYECEGLDVAAYEHAWNRVIARHPLLRTIITGQGRARILDEVPPYRIRTHDLTDLSGQRREARLDRLRERVGRQPGPADRWPLAQVQAALLPGGRVRLFIGVDVLVCDAASWWIIDRELRHFYRAPDAELPDTGIGFPACVAALEQRREGEEGRRAAAYWRDRLTGLPGAPALPVDRGAVGSRFVRRSATLDAEAWAALRERAARYHLTPAAVLLTGYADALSAWTGDDRFAVVLTLFDRPAIHPGVAGVVGDFTSLVLHEVDRTRPVTFAERARKTQELLFADLDHRDFSALDVLSEKASLDGERVSVPVVFTSALGLDDVIGADHDPAWAGKQVAALSQTPQTLIDHQVLEQGGALLLQWDTLEPALPPAEVDRVFADYVARVHALIGAPWDGPGEPERGNELDELDDLSDDDIAVPIRAGSGEHTLFLLHPSGGDVVCYAELARLLDERVEVIALTDPGLAGGRGAEDVAAMAARFTGIIRRAQPHGPYLLGGWSMGGDLAHEVARGLDEAGEHVGLLVMLDSNDPRYITGIEGPAEEVRGTLVRRYLGALEAFTGAELGSEGPAPSWEGLDARLREARLLNRHDTARTRVAVFARHLRALAAYTPLPLEADTPALLLRATQRSPRNSGVGMGVDDVPGAPRDLGWAAYLTAAPKVADIDAHHYSMLRHPALPQVAAELNAAIEAAIRRGAPERPARPTGPRA
ncbi:hypothetical protein BAY61_13170 [Prauserella marina]|uniref:Acyl transferase domain-containing protein n=1 Tax=Prauserella marina TaxID=530584 RepID=A0A222VPE7_9PSEU|nr:type I polyketide synthase [Prauserella marina]ASR35796.1 hypothetical protein BAY61_13170 [Prauserella marina]PWV84303.1 acyl transferase domain-containing protein [Prauserella marina]SDC25815.1 Acyl transferase domain-containing protein [Prauserella marina]